MCPFCIPVVTNEATAPKLLAKPAETQILMSSSADGFCNISIDSAANGCKRVSPPTVPSAKGIVSDKLNIPSSVMLQCDNERYCPSREA